MRHLLGDLCTKLNYFLSSYREERKKRLEKEEQERKLKEDKEKEQEQKQLEEEQRIREEKVSPFLSSKFLH